MGDFKQLKVSQKAQDLMDQTYLVTAHFPKNEDYGLVSQMRRAASSISANICEGSARQSDREFVRYLRISTGSTVELEGHLLSARRIQCLPDEEWSKLNEATQEIRRMLFGLIEYLRRSKPRSD